MQVRYQAEARAELFEAALYYDQRQLGLGDAFVDAMEGAIRKAASHPSLYPVILDDIQRCRVKRFPYCVYFRVGAEVLQVVAVAHHSRKPDYWEGRR
jgi:plasmid stabilization system protein ParE